MLSLPPVSGTRLLKDLYLLSDWGARSIFRPAVLSLTLVPGTQSS